MKRFTIAMVLILSAFAIGLHAQQRDVSIEISETKDKGLSEGNLGVIGVTDDGFYVLRTKGAAMSVGGLGLGNNASIFVDKYTNDLKKVSSASIDGIGMVVVGRAKGSSYEFSIQDEDNNLYIYFSEFVKGINSLYRLKLDTKAFEFREEELVYEDEEVNKRLDRRATYSFVESEDRNKFAIYSFMNERFSDNSEIYVECFNKKLESEWFMYEKVRGYQNGKATNSAFGQSSNSSVSNTTFSISLSNNGVVNVMQKIYDDSFANLLGAGNYFHQIYTMSGYDGRLKAKIFDNEEKFIVEAMIKHDQNDNLNLVGYVGDKERTIDGVIYRSMDAETFETITERISTFSPEQKKQFLISEDDDSRRSTFKDKRTERRIDKGRKVRISARNNLINSYVHDDNSITIAGEYFDVVTTSSASLPSAGGGSRTQTETNYIFGDMKFVNISQDGKVNWVKNIHKYQRSNSIHLLSVSELYLDNKINFVFNDFEKRQLMLMTIDQDGNHKPIVIADLGRRGELENHWFVPSSVKYLNESRIVGFANRLFKTKIIKIDL